MMSKILIDLSKVPADVMRIALQQQYMMQKQENKISDKFLMLILE